MVSDLCSAGPEKAASNIFSVSVSINGSKQSLTDVAVVLPVTKANHIIPAR